MATSSFATTTDALSVIYDRRAVRSYTPEDVDQTRICLLLDAAVQAPTAMHQEPWRFVVIQDRALLKRLSDQTRQLIVSAAERTGRTPEPRAGAGDGFAEMIADPDFNIFYDAGTLVLICAEPGNEFVAADCWLAAENLMLAACAEGLGTCCIGLAAQLLNLSDVKSQLGIPLNLRVYAPIIVGVPSGETPHVWRKPPVVLQWITPSTS